MAFILGKLGLKIPSLVNKDMSLITTFFDGMSIEGPETQLSLRVSLNKEKYSGVFHWLTLKKDYVTVELS